MYYGDTYIDQIRAHILLWFSLHRTSTRFGDIDSPSSGSTVADMWN